MAAHPGAGAASAPAAPSRHFSIIRQSYEDELINFISRFLVMQERNYAVIAGPAQAVLTTNKVLRNTYALLSMTLLFSALTAGVAIVSNAPPLPWFIVLAGYFGLFFL